MLLARKLAVVVSAWLLLSAMALAANLTGTVINGTSNKPAGGDEVVLLALSQGGMDEAARTKTDSAGQFTLPLAQTQAPHLVRVMHQGVTYHKMAPPGTSSVEVKVYDAARKLDGIRTTVQVQRYQSGGSVLEVLQLVAVKNASNPPRTLNAERTAQVSIPPEAQVDSAIAQSPGGQPVSTSAMPSGERGKYYFNFPLRPGETRFEIAYRMPYKGEALIEPKLSAPLEHFVVMLPKSMRFEAKSGNFQPLNDENANVQVSSAVQPGKPLVFRIAGTGMLAELQGPGEQGGAAAQSGPGDDMAGRPGGGLGAPSDLPDPLAKWRWYILGGFAVVLIGGAVYVLRRPAAENTEPAAPAGESTVNANGNATLSALKEELFQLEMERQQGRVTAEEYAIAKAALDRTLQRALSRGKPKN